MRRMVMVLPLAALAVAGMIFVVAVMRAAPPPPPGAMVGEMFPVQALTDLRTGEPVETDPATFQGPAVVNIFASWCAPCRAEHPQLLALKGQGVRVYGVAWKDAPADAVDFLDELGDPFDLSVSDRDGRLGDRLGVTGAPETFVVDADGRVRVHWRGPLTAQIVAQAITPALAAGAPSTER